MVQSPQDPSGGSEEPLSQDDIDAALNEAGLPQPASAAAPASAEQNTAPAPGSSAEPGKAPADLQSAARAAAQSSEAGKVDQAGRPFDAFASAMAEAIASEPAASPAKPTASPNDGATPLQMPDFASGNGKGKALELDKLQMLEDVQLHVRIELGRTRMLVQDVLRLDQGSVVELNKLAGDPVDVYVNERLVARGEVLVLNDNFCVRVNEIVSSPQETVA
jgi:flagellar motor switch protein FliN